MQPAAHKHAHQQTHGVPESSDPDQEPTSTSTASCSNSSGQPASTQYNPVVTMTEATSHPSSPCFNGRYTKIHGDMSSSPLDSPKELKKTTGSLHCYWTSPNRWTANRNVLSCLEKHDFQGDKAPLDPPMVIYKAILRSLKADLCRLSLHTVSSVEDALRRVQQMLNEQLSIMPQSELHLVCHFLFYDNCTLEDGTLATVEALITIEFYRAPRQTGTKIWNRRGSLIRTTGPWCEVIGSKTKQEFMELVLLEPLPSGCYPLQLQDTPFESCPEPQGIRILSEALMHPCVAIPHSVQFSILSPVPPNYIPQNAPVVSTSGLGLSPGPTFAVDIGDDSTTENWPITTGNDGNDLATHPQDTSCSFPSVLLPPFVNHAGAIPSHTDMPPAACVSPTEVSLQELRRVLLSALTHPDDNVDDSVIEVESFQRPEGDGSVDNTKSADGAESSRSITTNNKVGTPLSSRVSQKRSRRPQTDTNGVDDSQQPGPNPRPAVTTKPKPAKRTRISTPKKFPCPVYGCSAQPFSTQDSLNNHSISSHSDLAFQCDYCEKVYCRYGDCTRHEDCEHRGKRWKCKWCGLEYTRNPREEQQTGCEVPYIRKQDLRKEPAAKQRADSEEKGKHYFEIVFSETQPVPREE